MNTRFKSLAECEAFIANLMQFNLPVPQEVLDEKAYWESMQQDPDYIYHTLIAHAKFPVTEEKKACVENTVKALLEDTPDAKKPVLLLGKVQCGKTDTFENIVGLCFDRGIDICVVLTKGTKPLATQTLERLKTDFVHFEDKHRNDQKAIVNIYDIIEDLKKVGISEKEANKKGAKFIIVCKKEDDNLKHLISLFAERSKHLQKKKVLVVDDEADFASNNYRKKDGVTKLAVLTELIDNFIKIPTYCRYLQVTATPYSLFLLPDFTIQINSHGDLAPVFRPRHTELVPIHDKYIGGQQYYEDSKDPDSMYSYLFHPVSQKCVDVMGHRDGRYQKNGIASKNIEGLTYAVVSYFMAAAIRSLQEDANGIEYLTSGLIHTETAKKNQQWQNDLIAKVIDDVKNGFLADDFGQEDLRVKEYINTIYADYCASNEAGKNEGLLKASLIMPTKDDVINKVKTIFRETDYRVEIVNSDNDVKALLDKDGQLRLTATVNIFIGGNILDRGITINNMLCFFYGRDPKEMKMDTVIQHARMYGARSREDMAVMRFHTTVALHNQLEKINALDEELRLRLIAQAENPTEDIDFDSQLVGFDKGIKPCASQKIKISDIQVIKPHKRLLPVGFQTDCKTNIQKIINKIDAMLTSSPGYKSDDFFLMDKDKVYEILRMIRKTYVFKDTYKNEDLDWNVEELIGLIEYSLLFSPLQQVYIHHRTDRNMSRLRDNGGFIDAPDDGRTDTKPCRNKAQDIPVLMLLKENGLEQQGWRDAEFYWPVFVVQQSVSKGMYALNGLVTENKQSEIDASSVIAGINPEEILYLTINQDAFHRIMTYEKTEEYRQLTDTTASRYLMPSVDGKTPYALRSDVEVDPAKASHILAKNDDVFPFEPRPFKYILFRDSRDKSGSVMLVQLLENLPIQFSNSPVEDKDLLVDKRLETEEYEGTDHVLWTLCYNIGEVVGTKLNKMDQDWLDQEMQLREQWNTDPYSELFYANGRFFYGKNPYGNDKFAPSKGISYDSCDFILSDDGFLPCGLIIKKGNAVGVYLMDYGFGYQGARYLAVSNDSPFDYDTVYYNSSNPEKSLVYIAVEREGLWGMIKTNRMESEWIIPLTEKTFDDAEQKLAALECDFNGNRGWVGRNSDAKNGVIND